MLELILCSLLTIFPDYLYRRFAQGKRLGKEINLFSVWFELRWGLVGCLMLTIALITTVFYNHPATTNVTAFFRTVPIVPEANGRVAEIFIKEITEGIGSTGVKAGVIKVATGPHQVTAYERNVIIAAARAHKATGAPITTHTDEGTMGREQLAILAEEHVDPRRVVIGHSCGSADLRYHTDLLDRGAYLGFDRFGLELLHPDRLRLAALIGLLGIGFERQIVLSHDTVWCWRGRPLPIPAEQLAPLWDPRHVLQHIVPSLRDAGVAQAKIDAMLVDNPRRYFEGE